MSYGYFVFGIGRHTAKILLKWTLLPAKPYSLYRVAYFRFFTFYSLFSPAKAFLSKTIGVKHLAVMSLYS